MGNTKEELPNLKFQASDFAASVLKIGLNIVPFAGPLLSEVIGNIIPNQRIQRIIKFAEELEKQMTKIDQKILRVQLENEHFTDLLEEGILQASKSLSDERRQYIVSIIINGLTVDKIRLIESKHIMKILGEINDIEVILLRYYLVDTYNGDEEFIEKHKEIIYVEPAMMNSPQEIIDNETMHNSYKEHLVSYGLLKRNYSINRKTGQLELDEISRSIKVRSYAITSLGRLFLRQIGLEKN